MFAIIRYLAALRSSRSVPSYVKECRASVAKMTNNIHFPNPPIPLAQVGVALDELDVAEQLTVKGSQLATTTRNAKLRVVRSYMNQLKTYVQSVSDLNMTDSQLIIESAGMHAVKKIFKAKPELAVKPAETLNAVNVCAKALKRRASYQWQMRTGEEMWIDLPGTVIAKTKVFDLTPTVVYSFRFRTLTGAGLSDWSTAVTFIAH
jgi:hypothetical protein